MASLEKKHISVFRREVSGSFNQKFVNQCSSYTINAEEIGGKPASGDGMTLPQIPTERFAEAIRSRSGPLYAAAVAAAHKFNSELGDQDVIEGLDEFLMADIFPKPRRIKIMPDAVTVDGQWVRIFQDPMAVLAQQARHLDSLQTPRSKSSSGCATVLVVSLMILTTTLFSLAAVL